jgi:hypothetical protein
MDTAPSRRVSKSVSSYRAATVSEWLLYNLAKGGPRLRCESSRGAVVRVRILMASGDSPGSGAATLLIAPGIVACVGPEIPATVGKNGHARPFSLLAPSEGSLWPMPPQ